MGEKWHKDGLKFSCQRCGCCCGGEPGFVWVSPDEEEKISNYLGLSLQDFQKLYTRKVTGRKSLVELSGGDCCFLEPEGCRIYPVRPLQCRAWPFWVSNLSSYYHWREAAKSCIGIDKGQIRSQEEIENLLQKWNRHK